MGKLKSVSFVLFIIMGLFVMGCNDDGFHGPYPGNGDYSTPFIPTISNLPEQFSIVGNGYGYSVDNWYWLNFNRSRTQLVIESSNASVVTPLTISFWKQGVQVYVRDFTVGGNPAPIDLTYQGNIDQVYIKTTNYSGALTIAIKSY